MIRFLFFSRNSGWIFFFGTALIALYFTIRVCAAFIAYTSLQEEAKAQITQWEVTEKRDRCFLKATYAFEVQGNQWQGASLFKKSYFNEAAALADLKNKAKQSWIVWYNPKNPSYSTLEKEFPLALSIRMSICYGVVIYLFYLIRKIQSLSVIKKT